MSEPRVMFARTVRFKASHHYAVRGWDQETNRKHFGDAADPHDHQWAVTCWFQGQPNEHGMIVDLTHVDEILQREVVARFEDSSINEGHWYFKEHQPTTEEIAKFLGDHLGSFFKTGALVRVRVAECEDLYAEWHL